MLPETNEINYKLRFFTMSDEPVLPTKINGLMCSKECGARNNGQSGEGLYHQLDISTPYCL